MFLLNKIKTVKNDSGFTLVELMVTVFLISVFAVSAASFNRTSDQQIGLYREQGKVANAFYEARSQSITTYNRSQQSENVPCGYGIHIEDPKEIIIFKDLPEGVNDPQCPIRSFGQPVSGLYSGLEEDVQKITLKDVSISLGDGPDEGVSIGPDNPVDLLFVPPDPKVFSNLNNLTDNSEGLELRLSAPRVASLRLSIFINKFGQIIVQ